MKTSFIIYLLLMLIDGLVTFQATGTPMLLVLPFAGVMLYAALCVRPGPLAESVRLMFAVLTVTLGLMNFGGNMSAIFIALLSLPHLLAATQCLWEIQHAQTKRDTASPQVRLSVFSMAFYASCGVAFLLLKADDLRLMLFHQRLLAGLVIILSLAGWECSRVLRLRKGRSAEQLDPPDYLKRWGLMLGLGLAMMLLFMAAMPPVAEWASHFSPGLRPKNALDLDIGPPHKPKEPDDKPDPRYTTEGPAKNNEVDEAPRSGRLRLPKKVDLSLTEAPRAYLQFEDKAAGEALSAKGPLYLRTLALANYDNFQWLPSGNEGFWSNDEDDGRKDDRVTLTDPGPGALRYKVFVPNSDGHSVPALAGLVQVEVPKMYVLPDEWYQIKETGNLKYAARSQAKIWGQFDATRSHPGNPGLNYLKGPEGKLGDQLWELLSKVIGSRRAPEDVIPALMAFFHEHYKYSTKVENKNNLTPLENFLFDERKGYCDLFSTSAALLLRRADIPTRIGFGYMEGNYNSESGVRTFEQKHAHSWVEVNLKEHGWVLCDFTPDDETAPNTPGTSSPGLAGAPNLDQFDNANGKDKPPATEQAKIETPGFLTQIQALIPRYSNMAMVGVAGAAIFAGAIWMWFKRRSESQTPEAKALKAAELRDRQPGYFNEFVAMCSEFGFTRQPGETLRELQQTLKARKFYHAGFDSISHYHYQTRYEDAPTDKKAEESFIKLVREFRNDRRREARG